MTVREAVLKTLKENQGEWVSGETIRASLNVSRTAVWKQVKSLLAEGYIIESSPKKGYRINAPADLLSAEEVCPGLATQTFGKKHYFYYREIDSTNNRARSLAAEGYPEGTVVVAETQTAGRGRRGRNWYSPLSQGIYVSVILRPALPLREISRISLIIAVAVAETMESELNLQPCIKWPNDILIGNKKIAGILSEAVTDMDGIEYVVAGIGLNIKNKVQEFPADFRAPATSAEAENAVADSRAKVLQGLLLHVEQRYQQLLAGKFSATLAKARSLSVVIGQDVRLEDVNGFVVGRAIDIDESGFLLVRDQQGSIHTVMSGEIIILPSCS